MRYRYFVHFRHGISVFANFSYGIAILGTTQCPPHFSTPTICWKFSKTFGTHTDPFISDDVCFYSQPPVISLRQRLVGLKGEIAVEEKCGVIYNIKCKDFDAGRADIGETTRKLGTWAKWTSAEHANDAGHSIDWTSVKIVGQENHQLSRKIREAINIHNRWMEMNCDPGL